ncbi:MAG TPA: peptidylprolyl isomerase [Vicinamibacterales bacterium]|nr:peptidylprolyl isomerase [Vicinamibacterales bacterium]
MSVSSERVWLPLVFALAASGAACHQTAPAPQAVGADVWASVDGRQIRSEDVEKTYRRSADPNAHLTAAEATAAKLSLLDQLITQDLLVAASPDLKIEIPAADLDAAFNDQKKGMSEEAFNEGLAARGLTTSDVREALRRNLLAQKVVDHEVTAKITVTDRDISDYFDANRAQFNLPEEAFHITQIVVTSTKDAGLNNRTGDDATTPQAAAAKVQMLMERLKAGAAFSDLAMDFSEEPASAPRGGDVGMVSASSLRQAPANLRDAVLKAQPGQVTVVAMDGGYTIVGLVAKFPGGQRNPTMPDVHDGITATLKDQREQLLRAAYLEGIRDHAKVVNYEAQRIVDTLGKSSATPAPVVGR